MIFQILAIMNILTSTLYTSFERKLSSVFDKVNKLFARFTIRKWSKGTLQGNFMSIKKEEIQAEYIVRMEKPHTTDAMDATEIKAEKEIAKQKKNIFIIVSAINVVCGLASGHHEMALALFLINLISSITNNESIGLLIDSIVISPYYTTKILSTILVVIEMFLPYLPKKLKRIFNVIAVMASVQPLVTLRNETRKDWYSLDKTLQDVQYYNKNCISDYWSHLGLKNKQMTAVRVSAITPDKPSKQIRKSMRITDHFNEFSDIRKLSDNYGLSDLSNNHHVLSINKRMLSVKHEITLKYNDEFVNVMANMYTNLQYVNISIDESIRKALSTDGSAGEFAKRTMLEPAWKDQSVEEIMQSWKYIVTRTFENIKYMEKIDENFVQYMLYRKNEILPYDEKGDIKVTRLMNAPNLAARVCDTYAFYPMNEAIARSKWQLPGKIGINILSDLNLMITYEHTIVIICADFSDFDGSQHPYQMYGNCLSRVKHTLISDIDNKEKIKKISYIMKRYKTHWHRNVKSNDGIEIETIGQQASGDITTSDDNTMRSSTYMMMVIEEYNKMSPKKLQYEKCMLICSGDDINIITKEEDIHVDIFKFAMFEIAYRLGWKLKMVDVYSSGDYNLNDAMILSHGIKIQNIKINNKIFMVPVLTREKIKQWAKWDWAAEQPHELSNKTAAKLTAKMISFIVMLWTDAKMIVYCHYILLSLKSKSAITRPESYSWRQLDKIGVDVILPYNLLSMQIKIIFQNAKIKITIEDEDLECIKMKLKSMYQIKWRRLIKEEDGINWLDISKMTKYTINSMESAYNKNTKSIKGRTQDIMWWRETMTINKKSILPPQKEENDKRPNRIITCEHILIKCNETNEAHDIHLNNDNIVNNEYRENKTQQKATYYLREFDNICILENIINIETENDTEILCSNCESNKKEISQLVRTIRINYRNK